MILTLSQIVRVQRTKLGLTQEALAEKVGIARKSISDLENGKTSLSYETVEKIVEILGLKITIEEK